VVVQVTKRNQNLANVLRVRTRTGRAMNEQAGLGPSEMIYRPPQNAAWEDAWRVTEGLLVMMRDEVRRHGAEFWIVTLSTDIQTDPDPAERQALMRRLGVDTPFYPDLRIRGLAQREGIPVVTLAPLLARYAAEHHVALHGFPGALLNAGHWNENGHRVAGEILAEELCAHASQEPARTAQGHDPVRY